ncbi:hypothetical protein MMC29_002494 [Sticta canariensis]|nr:hypothetical protein [Sticta canariensis]
MARQTLQFDRLDIVATQGMYLVPQMRTPVFEKDYDEDFAATLARKLKAVISIEQPLRRIMYGPDADEWLAGHTPPEARERYCAEMRAEEEAWDITSDEASDNDEEGDAVVDGRAGAEKGQAASVRASRPQPPEVGWLPTPPLSAHNPRPAPHGKRRRRISTGVEEEEEEGPRKTHVTSTARVDSPEEVIPNGSQEISRKRRRADDVDDKGRRTGSAPSKLVRLLPQPADGGRGTSQYEQGLDEVEADTSVQAIPMGVLST